MAKKAIPQKVKKEIKCYLDTLKADKLFIQSVFLFGSQARGTQRKGSDIDLCIISPKFENASDALQYLWSKRKIYDVNYTIEPIGFSPREFRENSSLISEIKKTGIEITVP